jgi:hypothetical protein
MMTSWPWSAQRAARLPQPHALSRGAGAERHATCKSKSSASYAEHQRCIKTMYHSRLKSVQHASRGAALYSRL